jgi:hypothetical protein
MSKNFVTVLRSTFFIVLMIFGVLTTQNAIAQANVDVETGFSLTDTNSNGVDDEMEAIKGPVKKSGQHVEIGADFFIGLGINLLIVACIIIFIYFRNYKKLDTVFTFVLFNVVIFMLTYVFNLVKFSMGAAFGLFAIFSMLRYRTSSINMKDMTYLFIFIAVGLLSAIRMEYWEQGVIGLVIFAITYIMDTQLLLKRESMKVVRFDDINLILPEKEPELIEVLKKRTGLKIHRVSVQDMDFLKDSAMINIYYYEE